MRRTASEVLRSLEMRIARLERQATVKYFDDKPITSRSRGFKELKFQFEHLMEEEFGGKYTLTQANPIALHQGKLLLAMNTAQIVDGEAVTDTYYFSMLVGPWQSDLQVIAPNLVSVADARKFQRDAR
jgi:hypothetical protein